MPAVDLMIGREEREPDQRTGKNPRWSAVRNDQIDSVPDCESSDRMPHPINWGTCAAIFIFKKNSLWF
jgi:hypothetical protein